MDTTSRLVGGILFLGLMAGIGWFSLRTSNPSSETIPPEMVIGESAPLTAELDPRVLEDTTRVIPDGTTPYHNTRYGFSFYHAPAATVSEFDEGSGAMTVTLENLEKIRGMQIFIVPYTEATISEERFHMDVPSGVRENVQQTFVGGVEAVTFVSRDQLLGDTREVWLIHGGHLYEITTFRGAADWLTPILQSWQFDVMP